MLQTRGALLSAAILLAACNADGTGPGIHPPDARIVFEVDTVAVDMGTTVQVTARVVAADGSEIPNASVRYAVTHPEVASVSPAGALGGLRPGATSLRASSGGITAELPVDVFGHPEGLHVGRTPLGSRPFGIAVSRSGAVYVTRLDADSVARLDAVSRQITGGTQVGWVPTGVAFNPAGTTAYVTNQHSGQVGVVDVASDRQTLAIPLGGPHPFVPFVTPDGGKLYVTTNDTRVYVVSTATHALTDSITVGFAPNGFALGIGDTLLYVSSSFGGTVSEIDVRTESVRRTFAPGGIPQALVVSRDGSELYVANEAGWLDVYSIETGEIDARVALSGGGFGMALSPDQAHVYVTLANSGRIQVVNLPSRTIRHTFGVGGTPRRVAFTRHGGIAVVANEGGWVDFIR